MKQWLKILLVFVLLIAVVSFNIYSEFRWASNAENAGPWLIGSDKFNELLFDCQPAFGGGYWPQPNQWEIHGLKRNDCVVVVNEITAEDLQEAYDYAEKNNQAKVFYTSHTCKIPEEMYKNPEAINWNSTIQSGLC